MAFQKSIKTENSDALSRAESGNMNSTLNLNPELLCGMSKTLTVFDSLSPC